MLSPFRLSAAAHVRRADRRGGDRSPGDYPTTGLPSRSGGPPHVKILVFPITAFLAYFHHPVNLEYLFCPRVLEGY
jgi:hypothetical protein